MEMQREIPTEYDPSWNTTATGWPITPWGLRKVIFLNQYIQAFS